LHGKGRKEPVLPLLKPLALELKRALAQSPGQPDTLVFQNRFGQPLTRWGAEKRLRRTVLRAARHGPSLKGRAVSPHTFRHYADPRTMPTGNGSDADFPLSFVDGARHSLDRSVQAYRSAVSKHARAKRGDSSNLNM
jgi:integrase